MGADTDRGFRLGVKCDFELMQKQGKRAEKISILSCSNMFFIKQMDRIIRIHERISDK